MDIAPSREQPTHVEHMCSAALLPVQTVLVQTCVEEPLLPSLGLDSDIDSNSFPLRGCRQSAVPMPVFGGGRPSSSSTIVKPGPAWTSILLSPENLEWLSGLLAQLRGHPELPLAISARQLLVRTSNCATRRASTFCALAQASMDLPEYAGGF